MGLFTTNTPIVWLSISNQLILQHIYTQKNTYEIHNYYYNNIMVSISR